MTFAKIRRQNSVYYRFRRRAVGSHSPWGARNPNGLSSHIVNESLLEAEARKRVLLPCLKTVAQSWAALRKCWLAFNIAKSQDNMSGMQKYAFRIRKIQAQMAIRPTDFDTDILDENTVRLIDTKYRSQAQQNQELDNVKESRRETTELNYDEIMTRPNSTVKLPEPREKIFTSHYSRKDKSCPSAPAQPIARIEKKAPYYNQSCPIGPAHQKDTDQARINTHIVHHDRQCPSGLMNQDQNNFAVTDPNQPPVYQALEGKPRAKPAQHSKDPMHTIYENRACPYDSSKGQFQNSKKKQKPTKEGQSFVLIVAMTKPILDWSSKPTHERIGVRHIRSIGFRIPNNPIKVVYLDDVLFLVVKACFLIFSDLRPLRYNYPE